MKIQKEASGKGRRELSGIEGKKIKTNKSITVHWQVMYYQVANPATPIGTSYIK